VLSIRTKKARGTPDVGKRAPAGKDKRAPAGSRAPSATQPSAGVQPVASAEGTPQANFDLSGNGQQRPSAASGPRPGSRRALKNWRVRSRLLLLVTIPTVTAVILGGIRIASSVQSALENQRVVQLATLNGKITGLVQALQRERQDTITFITLGSNGGRAAVSSSSPALAANARLELKVLYNGDYAVSSRLAGQVRKLLGAIGTGHSELAQQDARAAIAAIDGLGALRTAAARSQLPALVAIQEYTDKINTLLALDDQVAVGSSDSMLAGEVRVVGLVSAMKEEASEQQALITAAQSSSLIGLSRTGFTSGMQEAITEAEAEQQANEAQFNAAATASQRQLLNGTLSAPTVAGARAQVQQAISLARTASPGAEDPAIANASTSLYYVVSGIRLVETRLVKSMIARSTTLRNSAITGVIIWISIVLLVLVLALLFTTIIGRSMVRPLRRLRAGALEVAGLRLPETVRRMSETDGESVSLDVEPIDVDSSDEIGEVARSFDQVHREAIRLAANEAALRGNVNAMFVNLSRRSQSLVERQIRLIDDLEQGEQDAERLGNLFQMDHLATRMRRNSENLLVLAGHDLARRWNQPVALVDVLRAAVSEIEQYERVSLNVQPGIAVRGAAVNDVVHLLAELAENATSLSSADTPVNIAGHLLTSGGVLLDITDQGVGMGAEEMAHANWRLDNPPVVDVAVSRRMGLFVVGRLAARHGIRVRLRPAASGGLTALVWLPDEVITNEVPGAAPSVGAFDAASDTGSLEAELAGLGQTDWVDPSRSAAEQEVSAARTPKFAPLRADAESDASLGPRRVPGAGLRGGPAWSATGPLPVFPEGSQQPAGAAERSGSGSPTVFGNQGDDTGQQPAFGGDQPGLAAAAEVASQYAAADPAISESAAGTGPRSAAGIGSDLFGASARAGNGESATGASVTGSSITGSSVTGTSATGRNEAGELSGAPLGTPATYSWQSSPANGGVIVPPSESLADENRLPIFEAVESDWFRHGRNAFSWSGNSGETDRTWTSPADEGWRAAETVSAPSSAGVTPAGLPKRVPQANLVPGTAAAEAPAAPTRSAAVTRERFASFQRGVREARAAASSGVEPAGEDETS
jgi:Nitrate and nitrite sensing/HAMP domain/Histidine kinase-, DNA gyrase B-, and HSP90-like ATPase